MTRVDAEQRIATTSTSARHRERRRRSDQRRRPNRQQPAEPPAEVGTTGTTSKLTPGRRTDDNTPKQSKLAKSGQVVKPGSDVVRSRIASLVWLLCVLAAIVLAVGCAALRPRRQHAERPRQGRASTPRRSSTGRSGGSSSSTPTPRARVQARTTRPRSTWSTGVSPRSPTSSSAGCSTGSSARRPSLTRRTPPRHAGAWFTMQVHGELANTDGGQRPVASTLRW